MALCSKESFGIVVPLYFSLSLLKSISGSAQSALSFLLFQCIPCFAPVDFLLFLSPALGYYPVIVLLVLYESILFEMPSYFFRDWLITDTRVVIALLFYR